MLQLSFAGLGTLLVASFVLALQQFVARVLWAPVRFARRPETRAANRLASWRTERRWRRRARYRRVEMWLSRRRVRAWRRATGRS